MNPVTQIKIAAKTKPLSNEIALCSAANENYVIGLAVALCSAIKGLDERIKLKVYVLDGGIREESWERLISSISDIRSDCVVKRLRPDLGSFKGLPKDWGSSVMAYARLALPELITDEQILYLDADVVIQGDVSELWRIDFGDFIIAAAIDVIDKDLGNARLPIEELRLNKFAPCLNSGVLMINVVRWRQADITTQALKYLKEWPRHSANWDQSALNVVLYGRWHQLGREWNTPAWMADCERNDCSLEAHVLHFVGPNKPWLYGYHLSPSAKIFFQWLDRTKWRKWRPNRTRHILKWIKYHALKAINGVRFPSGRNKASSLFHRLR